MHAPIRTCRLITMPKGGTAMAEPREGFSFADINMKAMTSWMGPFDPLVPLFNSPCPSLCVLPSLSFLSFLSFLVSLLNLSSLSVAVCICQPLLLLLRLFTLSLSLPPSLQRTHCVS